MSNYSLLINEENNMRDSEDSTGKLALAMIGGTIVAAPILGIWPVVGIIAVCGSIIYAARLFKDRR